MAIAETADKVWTIEEKADVLLEVARLENEGKDTEAEELEKSVPLPPYLAKIGKLVYGADFLTENGYNLSEANAKYGKDWLNR